MKYLKRIDVKDNIVVVCRRIEQGDKINVEGEEIIMSSSFGLGHKMAARNIAEEEKIFKFGLPIGSATKPIAKGEHIHLHNMKSDFVPTYTLENGFF